MSRRNLQVRILKVKELLFRLYRRIHVIKTIIRVDDKAYDWGIKSIKKAIKIKKSDEIFLETLTMSIFFLNDKYTNDPAAISQKRKGIR